MKAHRKRLKNQGLFTSSAWHALLYSIITRFLSFAYIPVHTCNRTTCTWGCCCLSRSQIIQFNLIVYISCRPDSGKNGDNRIYFSPKPIYPANGQGQYQGQPQVGSQSRGVPQGLSQPSNQNQGYQSQREPQTDGANVIHFQSMSPRY